jgi:prepilin-type N-terminal cleavage/methylation domain-containing protein
VIFERDTHSRADGMRTQPRTGFTIIELMVVVSIIAMLLGILLPAIGKARDSAMVNTSKSNLRQLGVAHKTYAADWADRHFTLVRDNLGRYGGDVVRYNTDIYGDVTEMLGHPPMIAGWGYTSSGAYIAWTISVNNPRNRVLFQPINFPGLPNDASGADAWGWFHFGAQGKPLNDYLSGRYHDPVFYAPKDRLVLERIRPCFELPGEFVGGPENGGIGPPGNRVRSATSYCLTAAGLFDPQAFADDGNGVFWTAPWEMPGGYRVPSFGHVKYPTLKTHMLEHRWLQNTKVGCNDSFLGCEPYFFNHSYRSMPVTLFYDGSVRLTSVMEAMSSDRRHRRQAGHGLWSRDTPFGDDGYLIADGYDFAATSYHILTIDGVRGRDTLGRE